MRTYSIFLAVSIQVTVACAALAQAASGLRNGLPSTTLDSFVAQSGEHAENIYGDEGVYGPPLYLGFSKASRINTGIMDQTDAGLTTGHGWYAPDSWGRDEFLGQEWSQSGARGRKSSDGFVDGVPDQMPPPSLSGDSGGDPGQQIPDPPGPGWQPMYQHGVWVGWYSPDEVALAQTDFPAALRDVVNSDHFWGDKCSILYEIGDIASPFDCS